MNDDNIPCALFLHVPKTAGTSFLMALQNTFGDDRVLRIHSIEERIEETIADIVRTKLGQISCLTGHLPLHLLTPHLQHFQPFTVLRDPVARVRSLYRFLKFGDPAVPHRLGLLPGFSLMDLLESRHPEIYGQVNDGMVRMLSAKPALNDPERPEFWDPKALDNVVDDVLTNLDQIGFGLAEEMSHTLRLAQRCWAVPYPMREYRENTTPRERDDQGDEIDWVRAFNTADLALYKEAQRMFWARVGSLETKPQSEGWNPRSVFDAPANLEVSIADIPGRQGFYEFEASARLAWLDPDHPAEINFVSRCPRARVWLNVYSIIPNYPMASVAITVNEQPLRHEFVPLDERWGQLSTQEFEIREFNRLTIKAPLSVPMRRLYPETRDKRRLGIALSNLLLRPAA